MIETFSIILIILLIATIIGKSRGRKMDKYQEYLHDYYFAVLYLENEYKSKGIGDEGRKLKIGSLSKGEIADLERQAVYRKYDDLIFSNPLRRKNYIDFAIFHSRDTKNKLGSSNDIGFCGDNSVLGNYFYEKYALLHIKELDEYIKNGGVFY